MYRLVVTSHTNASLSGVAKFNQILAARFGVPCVGFQEAVSRVGGGGSALVSVKMADLSDEDIGSTRALLAAAAKSGMTLDLFFHTFEGTALEHDLVEAAARVYCANAEIRHALEGFDKTLVDAWCPALVDLEKRIEEAPFNVFSFGMAHKMQIAYYRRLQQKLAECQPDYALWVSTAFHEKANFGDFHSISSQLSQVFGDRIRFLGFLSDEAINYFLARIQLFVAFFPKGVRANNTSIYVPMAKNLAVLTNLDEHSPQWMKHGVNVLDIGQAGREDFASERLAKIAARGRVDYRGNASWDSLVSVLQAEPPKNVR